MDEARALRMAKDLQGAVVKGWTIGDLLGYGKSALVFKASNGADIAALKVFDPELIERYGADAQEERLKRELSLIGKTHPNLVRIIDGGQETIGSTSYWLIVMEYISGKNLKDAMPGLPESQIRSVLKQIAEAARFLEENGQCHRDIKPENIVINDTLTEAKLLDFGIIRPLATPSDDWTGPAFIGTLRYAPPEFLLRKESDTVLGWRAVTFYQLGGLLHDMLTKRPLFHDFSEPYANLSNAVQQRIPDGFPSEPADLVQIAKSSLLKDPEARLRAVDWNDFTGESGTDRLADLKRAIARAKFERLGRSLHVNQGNFDERWKEAQTELIVEAIRQELQSDTDTFPRFEVYPSKVGHAEPNFTIRFLPSVPHALEAHASLFFAIEFPNSQEPIVECFVAGAVAAKQISDIKCPKMYRWFSGVFESRAARNSLKEVLLEIWLEILHCRDFTDTPTIVWEGRKP